MHFAIIGSRGYPSTYGGFETLVRRLAPFLVSKGHTVTVYGRGRPSSSQPLDGLSVVVTRGRDSQRLSTLTHGYTSCRHARGQGFDAALVLNVANGFFLPMLRRNGVPTVVNVDGIEWERDKWSRLGKGVFKGGAYLTAKHATALVADAQAIGRYWLEQFGVSTHFIPYGADVDRDASAESLAPLGLSTGRYALIVARLVPENNVELMARAALRSSVEKVVVVGSAVGESPIEHFLSSENDKTCSKLTWLGHVSDQALLQSLWTHAGAYLHGHSVGGTNPALLQAMGYGAPVLALDTVYNREVLGDSRLLVADDPDIISDRISALVSSPEERTVNRDLTSARVSSAYQWADVCSRYEELLCQTASSSSAMIDIRQLSPSRDAQSSRRAGSAGDHLDDITAADVR